MNRARFTSARAMAALAAILLPSVAHATITFQRAYGTPQGDWGWSVEQLVDGGYILAGYTGSWATGGYDIYLIRTDSVGDTLWTRTFGHDVVDRGYSLCRTTDSGYIVAGYAVGYSGPGDGYVVKTDSDGDTLWTRTYGEGHDECFYSGLQTSDSGYVFAGYTYEDPRGVRLRKTNQTGETLWTGNYRNGNYVSAVGRSLQQTTDRGYVIAGYTEYLQYINDVYLVKTNADGDTLWTRTYGGVDDDNGYSVCQTADSGYIIAGDTKSYGAGSWDVYLVRTDADGDTLWTRTYGNAYHDWGQCVQQTTDDGYIIVGGTYLEHGTDDVYLVKTDASGNSQWIRTFGGTGLDEGYCVRQVADDGYIIIGSTSSFGAGGVDVYLIKTDPWGNVSTGVSEASPTRAPTLSLSCEPNPSSGTTRISLTPQAASSKPLTLRVYDASGCLVHSKFGLLPSSFRLDLRSMPAGAYFLRCDAAGEHATARVVLQR